MMLVLTARDPRKTVQSEKMRKAISRNGDTVAENHASQMRGRAIWKVGNRGSEKPAKQKGKVD
jgi:hypothetical protein